MIYTDACMIASYQACQPISIGASNQVNNTLQVVLATDGVQTLAVFIYKDINWGQSAQIGFNVGDGYTAFVFPEALSGQTLYMDESSNVGKLGVYIHRIDSKSLRIFYLSLLPFLSLPLSVSFSTQFRSNQNIIISIFCWLHL